MDNLGRDSSKATNILLMVKTSNFISMECLKMVNRISKTVVISNNSFGTVKTTRMTMVMKNKLK
jgi:hypothetical protein